MMCPHSCPQTLTMLFLLLRDTTHMHGEGASVMCRVVSTLHLASYPHHAVSAVEEHCPCSGVCCYMFCPHSFQLQTLTTLFQLPRGDVPDEGPSGVVCFGMCCIHADSSCRPSPHSSSCRETLLMFPVRGQECVLSTPLPVEDLHHADPPAERRRMCLVRGPVAWCFVLCCVHTPSSCRPHHAVSRCLGTLSVCLLKGKVLRGVSGVVVPPMFWRGVWKSFQPDAHHTLPAAEGCC